MATPIKPKGRRARELNGIIEWETAQIKRACYSVLGATDPLEYHRAMKTVLIHAERIALASKEVEKIYYKHAQLKLREVQKG